MLRTIAVAVLAAGCATTNPTPGLGALGSGLTEEDRRIVQEMRAVAVRARQGEQAKLREELLARMQARPWDVGAKVLHAWVGAPSEDAWRELRGIATNVPGNPWPPVAMGLIYLRWKGFVDQADQEFDKALRLRPGFFPARVAKADVLRARGHADEAEATYEALLALEPGWLEAVRGLGLARATLKDPSARATLEEALKADPDDFPTLAALGKLCLDTDDLPCAVARNGRLAELNPKDRDARIAVAKLKEKQSDAAGAAAEYEAALAMGVDVPVLESLVALYKGLGRADEEAKAVEKLAPLKPREAQADLFLRLGELKRASGDTEGALVAYKAAAERRPEDPSIQLAVARIVKEGDDLIAAIEAFRQATKVGAKDGAGDLKELEARAFLLAKPLGGGINKINQELSWRLRKLYEQRQKEKKGLAGKLRVKVQINEGGKVAQVSVLEDTLHDEVLAAHVYFTLKDADYPREKRSPTFEFALGSGN